jgi:hypothetical protein
LQLLSIGEEEGWDGRREEEVDVRIICLRGRRKKKACQRKINYDEGGLRRGKTKRPLGWRCNSLCLVPGTNP